MSHDRYEAAAARRPAGILPGWGKTTGTLARDPEGRKRHARDRGEPQKLAAVQATGSEFVPKMELIVFHRRISSRWVSRILTPRPLPLALAIRFSLRPASAPVGPEKNWRAHVNVDQSKLFTDMSRIISIVNGRFVYRAV